MKIKNEYSFIEDIYFGENGLAELAKNSDYDIILTAVSGAIGIDATVEAIKEKRELLLQIKKLWYQLGHI